MKSVKKILSQKTLVCLLLFFFPLVIFPQSRKQANRQEIINESLDFYSFQQSLAQEYPLDWGSGPGPKAHQKAIKAGRSRGPIYQKEKENLQAQRGYEKHKIARKKPLGAYHSPQRQRTMTRMLDTAEIVFDVTHQRVKGKQEFSVVYGGTKISQLTYPIEGGMTFFNAEIGLTRRFSLGGRYGISHLDNTVSKDEDWGVVEVVIDGETVIADHYITRQNTKSKIEQFDANLYYNLFRWEKDDSDSQKKVLDFFRADALHLDALLGYQRKEGTYTMIDPHYSTNILYEGQWYYDPSLPDNVGLNSSYRVRYQGPRVGLRLKGNRNDWIYSSLSLAYTWLDTKAKGYWNLRDYHFWQRGRGGYAFDFALDVNLKFASNWLLGLGFDYRMYNQGKMEERGTQPAYPDYDWMDIIKDVKNSFYGPTFSLTYIW